MSWGSPRRPKIRYGIISFPNPREGSDGDIQIRETNLGAKLFGKIGGTWYGAPLTTTEGEPITRIGIKLSDHLSISKDKLEFMKNSTSMLSITSDGDINMTGKINITSTGSQNVMMGVWSATNPDVSGATDNIVFGVEAGKSMVSGAIQNVLIGTEAGKEVTTGDYNIAVGLQALKSTTTGDYNTAVGLTAGINIDEGDSNVCIGASTGANLEGGDNNILIGYLANVADADQDKGICIGHNFSSPATTLKIGDGSNYIQYDFSSGGAKTITVSSDERVKKNIVDTDIGLDFINALRPIKYVGKNKHDYPDEIFHGGTNPFKDEPREPDPTNKVDGFIAQEIKKVMDDMNVTFSGWCENKSSRQMLGYTAFIMPLTKAVQELSAKIDTMQTEINNLKAE